MARKYRLLIGSIGDDAHSVGIRLLMLGFKEKGFEVRSLGIRNDLSTFMSNAKDFDVMMISNNNGHAELYLQDFGRLISQVKTAQTSNKLWYLGGNLSVSEPDHVIKKKFMQMGFTNVFPKPASFEQVFIEVTKDLHRHNIHKREVNGFDNHSPDARPDSDLLDITDEKWSVEQLEAERRVVLTEWETGKDVDLNRPFGINGAGGTSLDALLWQAKESKKPPLLQPRTGVADVQAQIDILSYLEQCGIDIASVQLDAASRSKLYSKARSGIELSQQRQNSLLNGFPAPVHGVAGVRKIIESLRIPFQLRAGGPDHRFTYEIALNGGTSGVEGGFICYLMPYDKFTTPSQSLKYWQYVDRLAALYAEKHGVLINREYFGTLTANLIEPSLAIVVNIAQAILSAKQGVRSISLGYAEQGNRSQDIAALQVMEKLTKKYLAKYGLHGTRITTVFHQYMAAFPQDEAKAEELIYNSAITATLAGATKVMTKTTVEAFKIPSKSENARGVEIARRGLKAAGLYEPKISSIASEKKLLELEVTQLMRAIEELGNGSIARGAIRAIECGFLDIPFSPNIYNRNEVVTLRDSSGAVRFADFGQLPFDAHIKDFHRERIECRKMLERDSRLFSLLEKDLARVWKNDYLAWPLDDTYVV
jgi:methylaspartate mutase epsilon subunit